MNYLKKSINELNLNVSEQVDFYKSILNLPLHDPNYVFSKDFDLKNNPLLDNFGEDLVEWSSILSSIFEANHSFTMIELGAGYGRWCINAYKAQSVIKDLKCKFIAVEAEDNHFRFLNEYFEAHGLKNNQNQLIHAAVDDKQHLVFFHNGDSNNWYGQYIDSKKPSILSKIKEKFNKPNRDKKLKTIQTITLNSILNNEIFVDLIDMDIQSAELQVCTSSYDNLCKKVKRLHISTHSHEIHRAIVSLFSNNSWEIVYNINPFSESETKFGSFYFNDGMISLKNLEIK